MSAGRTLRLELKSATGRLSPEQKEFRRIAHYLGHKIHKVRSWKRFMEIVEEKEHAIT
jgi:hypothetical protein